MIIEKTIDLVTNEEIVQLGWQFMSLLGRSKRYHKDFNGFTWKELTYDLGDNTVDMVKKVLSSTDGLRTKVLYNGPCRDKGDLEFLMNLLDGKSINGEVALW